MHTIGESILRCIGWLVLAGLLVHDAGLVPDCLAGKSDMQLVHLYFSDAKRPFLIAEERVVINPGNPIAFGRQLVLELIHGSARGHLPTVPEGTNLRSFFLLEDGTAVADFSAQLRENHPGSCRREQLTLFSVVNSLILNVPEIDRVKILIDGAETPTLTGHLPLAFPLTADMLLTR
jgi:spore germination protein GerM